MKFHWGNGIFLFLAVFLALAFGFIFFALRQDIDLVTDDYYEKGADYTHQMELNKRSLIYTDSVQIKSDADFVQVLLAPSLGFETDSLFVSFFRPSDKDLDFNLGFALASDSLMVKRSKFLKGRYKVIISWKTKTDNFELTKDLFLN